MNTTPPHQLTRSRSDKYIGGVSGGLGAHFGVDPTFFRIGFIVATLMSAGAGLVAYLGMLAFVPYDDATDTMPAAAA